MPDLRIFDTPEATAHGFAKFLTELSNKKEKVTIALSGGSTPKLLFDLLVTDYSESINWSNLVLFWGDERMVAPDHEESNYKMTFDRLLSKVNIPEDQIFRVHGESTPPEEAVRYSKTVEDNTTSLNGIPSFDIVMLGLGADGHTASIFPPDMHLLEDSNTCAIGTNPESGQKRITITGNVINNAKHVCFLVTGASKEEKVDEIINQKPGAEVYPASHVQPKHGELIWFLDKAAASQLQNSFN